MTFVISYTTHRKFVMFDSSFRLSNWMDLIERVQYQAALAGTSTNKIYEESLSDRRWFHRLVQFFKIQNGFPPAYLKTPVPSPRNHLYGIRSENYLHSIKCRTNSYLNSFYPHTVKIWNELGPSLRQAPSLIIFKSNNLKLIRPEMKNVFNILDPKGMKKLFQLRVGLSPLRHHKKRHNFKDTLSDICPCEMSIETTDSNLL